MTTAGTPKETTSATAPADAAGEASLLAGLRVVDFSAGLAGSVAALLLAEVGAEVIKIEPPGGSPLRGTGGFAVWNRSKASLVLDALGRDRAHFDDLLARADVLITDLPAPEARLHGLDAVALARHAPKLIVCAITGFPEGHPDEALPTDDTLVLAAGGFMDEQQPVRRDGPTYLRFPLGSWNAAWLAAIGIAVRVWRAGRGDAAGPVATSLFEGALAPTLMLWRRTERCSAALEARSAKSTPRRDLFKCADGVWIHLMACADHTPLMAAALAAMGPEAVAQANARVAPHPRYLNLGANIEAFLTRPSGEWLRDLWAADVPAQPAAAFGALYADEQAQLNGYVVEVDDPLFGPTRQPGPPVTVDPPARVQGPAPRLDDARERWPSWPLRTGPMGAAPTGAPLAGIKVADFGNFLAGPLAAMLLADLGAEVVKIEAPQGDPMRQNEGAFLGCQRGKRSLALDLKAAAAAPVLRRVLEWADVVHHNLRMPAARKLGLGEDDVRKANRRAVYAHVSAYGRTGPRRDWPGYDQMMQASSGWEIEGAGVGNRPMWHRFGMLDHQAALASVFGVILMLIRRDRTGEGGALAASILGTSVLTTGETIQLADGAFTPIAHLDADQTGVSPGRRILRCRDGWVALVGEDAVAAKVTPGLAELDVDQASARLRAAGLATAPVRLNQGRAFFDSPVLRDLGFIATYQHPVYGRLELPARLMRLPGLDPRFERPPPTTGQHTREVLAQLGFHAEEVAELISAGVVVEPART